MRNLMDTARDNTGVTTLQGGYEGITYTGKNSIVGVIDTGIDYSRSDFNNADGATRVQYLRFQTASSGKISVVECAQDYIAGGKCTSIPASNDSSEGHGTHVTGIAASQDARFKGVAPQADIMLVRNDFVDDINEGGGTFTGGVLDGVDQIFTKADIIDKPAVINISQGTHIGAHDNTSLLEEGINEAVEGGYNSNKGKGYGRAVVAAAGNESVVEGDFGGYSLNAGGIHAQFSVANSTAKAWRLWVLSDKAPARMPLLIDVWFGKGEGANCKIAANAYKYGDVKDVGKATTFARAAISDLPMNQDTSDTVSDSDPDEKITVIAAVDAENSQNGKPRALVRFRPYAEDDGWSAIEIDKFAAGNGYVLDVIIRASGGSCTGNMWLEGGGTYVNFMKGIDTDVFTMTNGDNGNGYAMGAGDGNMIVGLPATATGAIAVGSFLQQKPFEEVGVSRWESVDGDVCDATDIAQGGRCEDDGQVSGGTVGERSPFSSIGPRADGTRKPEILAPGDPIISTLASGLSPNDVLMVDSTHWKAQGTSQASPHVAGFVALLFQKNNTLTWEDVKTAITSTGSAAGSPDNSQGWGRLVATNAIASVSTDTSGYSGTGNLKQSDLSSSSGGGCGGSIARASSSGSIILAAMLMLPLLVIFAKRKFYR
jgi:hypothetical protein